jgi:hypothetical protein
MDNTLAHILTMTEAKPTGHDQYLGHCLAHGSKRHRDLSIKLTDNKILLHCFAACPKEDVVSALGLTVQDLFTDAPLPQGQRPAPKPVRIDRKARAFQFELAALDLRMRADAILQAANRIDVSRLSDEALDRVMQSVTSAYADRDRAQLFEDTADGLMARHDAERTGAR